MSLPPRLLAEKGEAAQARFVERCRASWLVDSGYGRRRRGLRTASRMEHAYAQVDRGGYTAEQLVGWQTRRLAKGLPVGTARPGQGRGRKRGRPVGVEVEDAGQEQAPAEQVSARGAGGVAGATAAATGGCGRVAAHA